MTYTYAQCEQLHKSLKRARVQLRRCVDCAAKQIGLRRVAEATAALSVGDGGVHAHDIAAGLWQHVVMAQEITRRKQA